MNIKPTTLSIQDDIEQMLEAGEPVGFGQYDSLVGNAPRHSGQSLGNMSMS